MLESPLFKKRVRVDDAIKYASEIALVESYSIKNNQKRSNSSHARTFTNTSNIVVAVSITNSGLGLTLCRGLEDSEGCNGGGVKRLTVCYHGNTTPLRQEELESSALQAL
ncbi:hypothetical protein HZH68_011585 [Vespula germanica]|uniref:Uncharacterized protein n=1 Tax=Vespula germanica TaxID=30212 RepID=A0A834N0L6_VESGE|nr:hypothetical protein HZH68_011585 [Vespula germanica]